MNTRAFIILFLFIVTLGVGASFGVISFSPKKDTPSSTKENKKKLYTVAELVANIPKDEPKAKEELEPVKVETPEVPSAPDLNTEIQKALENIVPSAGVEKEFEILDAKIESL